MSTVSHFMYANNFVTVCLHKLYNMRVISGHICNVLLISIYVVTNMLEVYIEQNYNLHMTTTAGQPKIHMTDECILNLFHCVYHKTLALNFAS